MPMNLENISSVADVEKQFGLSSDTSGIFDPLYKRLATQKAGSLRGAALRAGRSASPGMTFSPIEQGYNQDMLSLLGKQGETQLDQKRFIANMLSNISQFNAQNQGPGLFDYFSTILGAASNPVAALLSPGRDH